jgi:hypothetical protein
MTLPTPDAPFKTRALWAVGFTVCMPVLWPMLTLMFFAVWLIMGVVIAVMCVLMLALPLFALVGIEEKDEEEWEVTVPKDKAPHLKLMLKEQGAKVKKA